MSFWLVQNHSDFIDLNNIKKEARHAGKKMKLKI